MKKFALTCLSFCALLAGLAGYGIIFPQSLIGATFLTITDGTHTVTGTQKLTVTGGTVGGTHNAATLAISGGGALTTTDGTHSVANTITQTFGSGLLVGGSAGNATIGLTVPHRTVAGNATVGAADMAGQLNISTSAIVTIPAISSTVFASGMTAVVANISASGTVTLSSTPTINGCPSTVPAGGFVSLTSNGTSLDCFGSAGSAASVASLNTSTPALKLGGTGSGPFTGAVTVDIAAQVRSQAGGSLLSTDASKLVYNTGGTGATLPAHTTTGFGSGFAATVLTDGTAATLSVTTDTCNGNSTEPLGIKQGIGIFGDGTTTYKCLLGMPEPVASSVLAASSGRVPQWATTLPAGLLPTPGSSTLGGVESRDCSSGSQFVQKINTDGTETCATPSSSPAAVHYGATSQTITNTQWLNGDVFVVTAAGQTLTLPVVTGLSPSGGITIITLGPTATVTLAPNAADGINGNSTGAAVVVPIDIEAKVTTSGSSGTAALTVPLGPPERFMLSWGASQNLSTPGVAGIPIGRVGGDRTLSAIYCDPTVLVGGSATFDVYAAPSATALGSGTKLNITSCDANTGTGVEQVLGVASASIPGGSWIGIVATGAGWASSAGWGAVSMTLR